MTEKQKNEILMLAAEISHRAYAVGMAQQQAYDRPDCRPTAAQWNSCRDKLEDAQSDLLKFIGAL